MLELANQKLTSWMNRHRKDELGDVIRMRGSLEYELRNAITGEIIKKGRANNVVNFKGRGWALNRIGTDNANYIQAMGLGTHTSAPNSSQTGLGAYFSAKAIGTTAQTTATDSAPSMSFAASWSTGDTHASSSAINEFCLYNSSASDGTMFNRVTTSSAINFGSTNTLAITMTISN